MKTLQLLIELTYDPEIRHGDSINAKSWFYKQVLQNNTEDEGLVLYSNLIGDTVGDIRVLKIEEK